MEEEASFEEKEAEETGREKVYYEHELSALPGEKEKSVEETTEKMSSPVNIRKPYLEVSDLEKGNPEKELVLLEWLDFLLSENDIENLIKILSYYVDLGWISKEVRTHLISYARGFTETSEPGSLSEIQMDNKKYRIGESQEEITKKSEEITGGSLKTREHIRSLVYILEIIKEKIPEDNYERILERVGIKEKEKASETAE